MYLPRHFQEADPQRLCALMERHPFATLVTVEDGVPLASPLPLLLERGADGAPERLVGHMARANPQWRGFREEREVLAVFHGPHAYISPRTYATAPNVPTWNYATVHAHGRPRLLGEPADALRVLRALAARFESGAEQPWTPESAEELVHRLLPGIAAFELRLTRLEGKFKLGQNRSPEDQRSMREALAHSVRPEDRELAALMAEG